MYNSKSTPELDVSKRFKHLKLGPLDMVDLSFSPQSPPRSPDFPLFRQNFSPPGVDVSKRFKFMKLGPLEDIYLSDKNSPINHENSPNKWAEKRQTDNSDISQPPDWVKGELQYSDIVIFVQHCHQCDLHNSTLRHDPQKYRGNIVSIGTTIHLTVIFVNIFAQNMQIP